MKKIPLAVLFLDFIVIFTKLYFLFPTFSDEIFYINIGKVLAETHRVLYKEIFFAHPPLQPFLLATFWYLFHSFYWVKFFGLAMSFCIILLFFMFLKRVWDAKIGSLASLFLLFSIPYLVFSNHFLGAFESLFLSLLSLNLFLRKRISSSAYVFTLALFVRYLSILFLPIFFLVPGKRKEKKKFVIYFFIFSILYFLFFSIVFGKEFLSQTIYFHVSSKILSNFRKKNFYQYINYNIFPLFSILISFFLFRKRKSLLLLSSFYIFSDLFILLSLNQISFHYFLFSNVYGMIIASLIFSSTKDKEVKVLLLLAFLCYFLVNLPTLFFYFKKENFSFLDQILEKICDGCKVFGDPIPINYAILNGNIRPIDNLYDTYPRHLKYRGIIQIKEMIKKEKPILVFCDNFYEEEFGDIMKYYSPVEALETHFGACEIYYPKETFNG